LAAFFPCLCFKSFHPSLNDFWFAGSGWLNRAKECRSSRPPYICFSFLLPRLFEACRVNPPRWLTLAAGPGWGCVAPLLWLCYWPPACPWLFPFPSGFGFACQRSRLFSRLLFVGMFDVCTCSPPRYSLSSLKAKIVGLFRPHPPSNPAPRLFPRPRALSVEHESMPT